MTARPQQEREVDGSGGTPAGTARQADRGGGEVRALLHAAGTASLATSMADEIPAGGPDTGRPDREHAERDADGTGAGVPYASLVAPAPDMAGAPLLFLSDLAQHTRNLAADPRACLLLDGTAGYQVPLAGPRASLQGRLILDDTPTTRGRYLRWQPQAEQYAELSDFRIYRLELTRAHLVSGFGRVRWLSAEALRRDLKDASALIEQEAEIVQHVNADHLDALAQIAHSLSQGARPADGVWTLAGVDPEGADLIAGSTSTGPLRLRAAFTQRVTDAQTCRQELVRLTQQARQRTAN